VIEEYKKATRSKRSCLDVTVREGRISLGIKQLEGDPFAAETAGELRRARS